MRTVCLLLLGFLLTACGPAPEQDQTVRSFFERVRTGDFDALQQDLAPNLKGPEPRSQFEAVRREFIPREAPSKTLRVNWRGMSIFGGDTTAVFVYRYDYPDCVLLVTTVTRTRPGEAMLIEGFNVNVTPLGPETEEAAKFSFEHKATVQWAFFGGLVCSVLLMLMAFFGTLFTKGFKRKWLFAIVSLVGAPVFSMNWASAQWSANFMVGLVDAAITRGMAPLDPWILQFHLPVGALIVLSLLWPRWAGLGEFSVAASDGAKDVELR